MPESERPDLHLVERMLGGEEAAFDEFFHANFGRLFRFTLARVGSDADAAEEIVQAALCKAVGALKSFRGEASLFTWLCTFCRHEVSGHYRQARRGGLPIELVEDEPEIRAALESLAMAGPGPESELRRKEVGRLVQVTLDALPVRYADALEWKYIHGLSVAEIAGRLALGSKAAESLLSRARQAFRDAFATLARGRWSPGSHEA